MSDLCIPKQHLQSKTFSLQRSQCTQLDIQKNDSQTDLKTGKLINVVIK